MHEMSLVEAILESLVPLCVENRWRKIERVVLRIGSLRQVIPEALVFCFEAASSGTPLADASIEIKEVPIRQKCASCGLEWEGEVPLGRCSGCRSVEVETIAGLELEIEALEVLENGDEKG
jgi:hydrogenase nickel incorporation protein HypA/HybF